MLIWLSIVYSFEFRIHLNLFPFSTLWIASSSGQQKLDFNFFLILMSPSSFLFLFVLKALHNLFRLLNFKSVWGSILDTWSMIRWYKLNTGRDTKGKHSWGCCRVRNEAKNSWPDDVDTCYRTLLEPAGHRACALCDVSVGKGEGCR